MDIFVDIVWFLAVGIAIVVFLLLGFWLGQRVRDREPAPPSVESHPRLPVGGQAEICEDREYVDFPEGGLRPHEFQGYGNFGSRSASSARSTTGEDGTPASAPPPPQAGRPTPEEEDRSRRFGTPGRFRPA
jgi:hypothetical protein